MTTRLATLREFVFSVALQRGGAAGTTADEKSSGQDSSGNRLDKKAIGKKGNSIGVTRRSPPGAEGRNGTSYNHSRENSTKTNHHHSSDNVNKIMDGSHDTSVVV